MRTLCVGEALVDLVCERPVASLAEADAFVPHFGGAIANVAVDRRAPRRRRRAGRRRRRRRVGRVAARAPGGRGRRPDLVRSPRRDRHAGRVRHGRRRRPAVVPDLRRGLRTAVTGLGDRLLEAVDACDALFFSSNTLVDEDERALTLAARDRALAPGKPVIVDPNLRLQRWRSRGGRGRGGRAVRRGAFLVKCNAGGGAGADRRARGRAAAASLLAAGARHVVVTLGADGALLRGGGLDRDVPGVPARPVDATGAGDAVTGVLLAALAAHRLLPPGDRRGAARRGRRRRARDRALRGAVLSADEARDRPARRLARADARRARPLRERLRDVYGVPSMAPHERPARRARPDRAVAVDERPQPRRRVPAPARALRPWEAVRDAPVEEIEEAIRPGGISKVKSAADPGRSCVAIESQPRRRPRPGLDARRPGRRVARLPLRAAGRRAQDRRLRAAVLLRPARRAGRHPRLARRDAAAACCARARRSTSSTTRCSR